ncbi:unnamed protein product [Peniophora sp. CBMAI 1063]|nr:unnamed protein product [Peniophora sp. CBMAI 1063]
MTAAPPGRTRTNVESQWNGSNCICEATSCQEIVSPFWTTLTIQRKPSLMVFPADRLLGGHDIIRSFDSNPSLSTKECNPTRPRTGSRSNLKLYKPAHPVHIPPAIHLPLAGRTQRS